MTQVNNRNGERNENSERKKIERWRRIIIIQMKIRQMSINNGEEQGRDETLRRNMWME